MGSYPGSIDLKGVGVWQSSNGDKSLDMDGTPGFGGVKQTLVTIPGQKYRVMFDLAGNPYAAPTIKTLGVEANGQSNVYTFDTTGKRWEAMDWRRDEIFDFTAGDTTTTLTFTSLNQEGGFAGAALDNVRVYALTSSKNEHIVVVRKGEEATNVNFGLARNKDYTGEHDLQITNIDAEQLTVDPQLLTVEGPVTATIKNAGVDQVNKPFTVAFFEDRNYNKAYDSNLDTLLSTVEVDKPIGAGDSLSISADLSAFMAFAHAPIWGVVDLDNVVVETDETNNLNFSDSDCLVDPVIGQFNPVVEWAKTEFSVAPESNQVVMTPTVIDLNSDGIPDIIFSTSDALYFDGFRAPNAKLRAISGDNGSELWTVNSAEYEVNGLAGVAVGDLDNDGKPEIVAGCEDGQSLIAFENDGTFKWKSQPIDGGVNWGSASIADLDSDGAPEIVIGSTVLNNRGDFLWSGVSSGGLGSGQADGYKGPLSIVGDLDLDGKPEVIAGRSAFQSNGTL